MADPTPHLLLVDDEAALRQLTAERLTERGFEVVQAESGEQALELIEQFAFDLLITDLRLPGIDGTEVIDAGVTRADADEATVLLVIQTTRETNASDQAEVVKYRIEVEMQTNDDGRWLLTAIRGA